MKSEDNFFWLLFKRPLHIFKAKKCLDLLLKGAILLIISLVHSPILNSDAFGGTFQFC